MQCRCRKLWVALTVLAVVAAGGLWVAIQYGQPIITAMGITNAVREGIPGNEDWAMPLEMVGVENFHKVSDDLYRGAQPTAEGMKALEKFGIRTVFNLRSLHSDRDELVGTGLMYEHITMTTWNPKHRDFVHFLKTATDPDKTPIFVHCQRGSDRTGTMCAAYRIVVQGWTPQQALDEMTRGGFGFYSGWRDLVACINTLDAERLRKDVGLAP